MKKLFTLVALAGLGLGTIGCGEAPKPAAPPAKPAEGAKPDEGKKDDAAKPAEGTAPAPAAPGGGEEKPK